MSWSTMQGRIGQRTWARIRSVLRLGLAILVVSRSSQDDGFTKVLTLNLHRAFTLVQKCLPLLQAAAEQSGKSEQGSSYKDPARIINVCRSP